MRLEIQGSPSNFQRLTARDVPPQQRGDPPAFLRFVRADAGALDGYDFTDADILDSEIQATRLDVGKTGYMMSRRVDWPGVTLPSDLSSYNSDLMVELYRQAPNSAHPIAQFAINHIHRQYQNSWTTFMHDLLDQTRYKVRDVVRQALIAQAGFPAVTSRMAETARVAAIELDGTPITSERTVIEIRRSKQEFDTKPLVRFGTDRWAEARMMERLLGERPLYVASLDPLPVVVQPRRGDEVTSADWYREVWPIG
jgi:hypothetical protein